MALSILKNHSKKLRTVIFFILTSIFVWLVFAAKEHYLNNEYARITSLLENQSQIGDCKLELEIEKRWLQSWTPEKFQLTVNKGTQSLNINTNKWFQPSRIVEGANYKYQFLWSNTDEDSNIVASILNLDISIAYHNNLGSGSSINRLELQSCAEFPSGIHSYSDLNECLTSVELIECSLSP